MTPSLYADPRTYDLLFADRTDDVAYYRAVACGRVLEYGCGTGRITLPLAAAGHDVTAVDPSSPMLARLAERLAETSLPVRHVLGDATTLSLGERFDTVLFPFNGLAHVHDAAGLAAFFARVHDHLAPGGRFAFDLWIPEPRLLDGAVLESGRFDDPLTGEPVTLREEFSYDALAQVLTTRITLTPVLDPTAKRGWMLAQRQFFPEETRALLAAHGFDVRWRTTRWRPPTDLSVPGFDDAPLDERGAMLAYVCFAR